MLDSFAQTCVKVLSFFCLLLLCSCANAPTWYAPDLTRPQLPPPISFNKDAGRGGSLFVTLHLEDGKELLFGIDTGSPDTILDKSLEPILGKRIETRKILYGWMGNANVGIYGAPKIYLGNVQLLTGDKILTDDLTRMYAGGRPMVGILGMDCLHHYCIQLDFAESKMRFLDPQQLDKNLGKGFPLTCSQAGITIQGNLLDIEGGASGVDSGEYLDGSLKSELFQRAILEKKAVIMNQWTNLDGTYRREAICKQSVFGNETYTNLVLGENLRGHNFIGLRFLSRHLVTFDFPGRIMYLKRPDRTAPNEK